MTLALPVGRGALGLCTVTPLPAQPLVVPALILSGCIPRSPQEEGQQQQEQGALQQVRRGREKEGGRRERVSGGPFQFIHQPQLLTWEGGDTNDTNDFCEYECMELLFRLKVVLDLSAAQPAPGGGAAADVTAWPEFHNGVAAGLQLAGDFQHQEPEQEVLGVDVVPLSTPLISVDIDENHHHCPPLHHPDKCGH